MKKIYLTALLAVFTAVIAKAQYFQHVYGYESNDYGTKVQSGMVTSATGPGHVVAGLNIQTQYNPLIDYGIYVLRTDVDGRIISPNEFSNTYLVTDASGVEVRVMATAVVELSDGSGYAAIGSYANRTGSWPSTITGQGIAYLKLDLLGNVVAIQGYQLSSAPYVIPYVTGLRESTVQGELFATGTNGDNMWALKIDQNGTLLWGETYFVGAEPEDIIASPYGPTVIIVGAYNNKANGFWMEVDPNTGTCTRFDVLNSWPNNGTAFLKSIDVVPDPTNPGFIVAGESDGKAWVTRTNPWGGMVWSGHYSSAARPFPVWFMRGYDAVCREKQSDDPTDTEYEFFVTGPIWEDVYNGDAFVFKLDAWGNPVNPNGLFSYSTGWEETGVNVDVNTSGTADGVSMYATNEYTPGSEREIYIVKAYFNGVSGCNEEFEDLHHDGAELYTSATLAVGSVPFGTARISLSRVVPKIDTELCHNTSIPGGSNARVAPSEPAGDKHALVSPNPMGEGTGTAMVDVKAEAAEEVSVTIYDMLGKQYYSGKFTLAAGINRLPVDISNSGMSSGMYTVKIAGTATNYNLLLLVK